MPVISRGKPAFASSGTASGANDSSYSTYWRSSGAPAWLAYDLSSVPAAHRGQVVVGWYNDPITTPYDHTVNGDVGYNNLGQLHDPGQPGCGRRAAAGQRLGDARHRHEQPLPLADALLDMTGNNWLRINVTASDGSSRNNDAEMNMDVHDASADGASDSWIFYGDSITEDGMPHEPMSGSSPNFSQLINTARPAYFPAYEDGGIGGLVSGDGASHINSWLSTFPGRFVGLAYGTNDANGCMSPTGFYNNYVTMVQAVINAGKVPIVPTIPWARTQRRPELRPRPEREDPAALRELPAGRPRPGPLAVLLHAPEPHLGRQPASERGRLRRVPPAVGRRDGRQRLRSLTARLACLGSQYFAIRGIEGPRRLPAPGDAARRARCTATASSRSCAARAKARSTLRRERSIRRSIDSKLPGCSRASGRRLGEAPPPRLPADEARPHGARTEREEWKAFAHAVEAVVT